MKSFLFGIAGLLIAATAGAQSWPSRPVTVIVASTAGGPLDTTARMTADWWQKRLGQTFVVENRPGGGNLIAIEAVLRAPGDGYTLLGGTSQFATGHLFVKEARYHPVRDATPIGTTQGAGFFLSVPVDRPYRTMAEIVAWSKANPGKLNIAESGGTEPQMEDLYAKIGLVGERVRYKGGAPMFQALLAGEVDFVATNAQQVNQNATKIRALAYTDTARHPAVPNVPTVGETILPGYYFRFWLGFLGPAGIPAPIVTRLNTEIGEMLKQPDVIARIRAEGREPLAMEPQFMRREIEAALRSGEAMLARGIIKPQ